MAIIQKPKGKISLPVDNHSKLSSMQGYVLFVPNLQVPPPLNYSTLHQVTKVILLFTVLNIPFYFSILNLRRPFSFD